MTVGELIEELEKLDEFTEIFIHNGDGIVPIDEIELDKFYGHTRKVILK